MALRCNPMSAGAHIVQRRQVLAPQCHRVCLMQAVTSHRSSACDRLDDEIAALEVAVRLAVPAEDVDFDALLDRAESDADDA